MIITKRKWEELNMKIENIQIYQIKIMKELIKFGEGFVKQQLKKNEGLK